MFSDGNGGEYRETETQIQQYQAVDGSTPRRHDGRPSEMSVTGNVGSLLCECPNTLNLGGQSPAAQPPPYGAAALCWSISAFDRIGFAMCIQATRLSSK